MRRYTNDELPALGVLLNRVEQEILARRYARDEYMGLPNETARMSPEDVERRRLEGERMHKTELRREQVAWLYRDKGVTRT